MPTLRANKKDEMKKKRNLEFTQDLLSNEHQSGQVELRDNTTAYNPMGASSPTPQNVARKLHGADSEKQIHDLQNQTVFEKNEGYKWELCIVVPNPYYSPPPKNFDEVPEKKSAGCCSCFGKKDEEDEGAKGHPHLEYREIIERLHLAGLQTYSYRSGDGDEIFIKVRAPLHLLQDRATDIGMDMLYDSNKLRNIVDSKDHPIQDDSDITHITPFQYIYGSYRKDADELFARADGFKHAFSFIIRSKLLLDIIYSDDQECCNLNLRKLLHDGEGVQKNSVIAFFPLHDDDKRDELTRSWLNWKNQPWEQPLDDVKEYFGEKVALYFEFTAHYTTWLVTLSFVSALVILDLVVEAAVTDVTEAIIGAYSLPFYCIFVAFWSQFMIEYWKRKQITKSMEWGTTQYEEEERERPEFHGHTIKSYIDGKEMKYFSPKEKLAANTRSFLTVFGMIVLVLTCVSVIFASQYFVNTSLGEGTIKSLGNTAVSVASAIQIIVLNSVYSEMAIRLTNEENHRTDTDFDDALIGKLFAFSFINSYAALFFIAFIKGSLIDCQGGACMVELSYQLTVIFATKVTVDKVSTYFSLVVNRELKAREEAENYKIAKEKGLEVKEASKAELEYRLENYDPSLGVLEDYGQIFIQFGYVTLFVAACPLAPILAYFSNFVEIRSDGYKLLYFMRRVIPTGCEDIGTWQTILQLTAYISVATNAALLCFTMKLLPYSAVGQVWTFVIFQYVVMALMSWFEWLIDDTPPEVQIQLARQAYLVDRAEMSPEERANDGKKEGVRARLIELTEEFLKPKDADDEEIPQKKNK